MARTMSLNIDDDENGDGYNEVDDPFYSPENMARLKGSIARLESGKGVIHEIE